MPDRPARIYAKVTLDDGRVLEAAIDARDYRRWDLTRAGKNWPPATDAPFLFQDFTAAAALIRAGDSDETDPAALMERIVSTDADRESPIRPTPPVPGSG